jgi:hypothetical protein
MGGGTCHLEVGGTAAYARASDLLKRDLWLARRLADEGYVYVSTAIETDDIVGKAVLQHLGFDFVYQTTTCILSLTQALSLRDAHEGFHVVDPASVDVEEVVEVCTSTLKHGRFYEDLHTRDIAGPRNSVFLRDLHRKAEVYRIFTRSPSGRLNGYAYVPLKGSKADLLMMGILESAAPSQGGQIFWEMCLAELRSKNLAQRVQTRVPAANLGVLNIYAKIGFNFIRPEYDFRMFPSNLLGYLPAPLEQSQPAV